MMILVTLAQLLRAFKLTIDNPLTPYFYYDNYADDFTYNYMLNTSNFFIPRLGLIPAILFFNNYLCINFIFGFFALGGAIRLFKTFHHYYPAYTNELALATIFLPSVGFWSSGLLKDTVCFGSIGFILYAVLNIFVKKTKIRASLIWIIGLWIFSLLYQGLYSACSYFSDINLVVCRNQ